MEWVQGAMVVAAPCSTRGSNNSEGSVGTAALRDIAVPDPLQQQGISGSSAAVEPISDKFLVAQGLLGSSCKVPRDLATGQLPVSSPGGEGSAAAGKCSTDCRLAGKI